MRIALVCAAGLLAATFLVGCGSEKELPEAVAIPEDKPQASGPPIPTESEASAKAIVARCLNAATAGDPTRLKKLRTSRISLSGSMQLPGGAGANVVRMECTQLVEVAWPDRARLEVAFQSKVLLPLVSGVRWPSVWSAQQQIEGGWKELQPSQAQERLFLAEYAANIAFPFLLALDDSRTIVYGSRTIVSGQDTAEVIQAHVPSCPEFTLWFDPKTGHLMRADFAVEDGQQLVRGSMGITDHKDFEGLILPGKLAYGRGGVNVAEWKVDRIEILESIDAVRFDPPRSDAKP